MRKAVSFVVLAIVLAVTACGGGPPVNKTKVNYLTSFSTFGRDAYVYVAQERGSSSRPISTSPSRPAPAASTC